MPGDNNIETLILDYYLHDLSPAELARLQDLLASDPDVRRQFVDAGRDEWLLHDVHHMDEGKLIRFEPRRKKRRRIRAIAAGITLLISIGTIYYAQHTALSRRVASIFEAVPVARVSDMFVLEGDAISVVNNGKVSKLNPRSKLHAGDRIVIPPGCRLSYQYLNEETHVELDGGSLFTLSDAEGAKHIFLSQGRLYARVARQQDDRPMRVETRDAEAVVLGTAFEIMTDRITRLSVSSGQVRFKEKMTDTSVVVGTGYTAETDTPGHETRAFRVVNLTPLQDRTLNHVDEPEYIAVDPVRNYTGFLTFDLGEIEGTILEAKLKLRVMKKQKDHGGSGNVRLFLVNPENPFDTRRVQVSNYSGKVGWGMDLEFDIDPSSLSEGIHAMMIALDKGGNDFWFSSSRGAVAPSLMLKVVGEE